MLKTEELTEKDAKSMCLWRYEPPYDVYDLPCWESCAANGYSFTNEEKRKSEYYSVYENGSVIGFFRLKKQADCISAGLGLAPEHCGKGFGTELMTLIIKEYKSRYQGNPLRLEVRDFNERAVRCYASSGFRVIGSTEDGKIQMEYFRG